ncbi:MAG: hypothetical protein AABX96_03445 [Nanoarchaeota archaeon]
MERDKTHMESVERWAEFVRTHPRSEWKPVVNTFINAVYEKADDFYNRLAKSEEGREILKRLNEERVRSAQESLF